MRRRLRGMRRQSAAARSPGEVLYGLYLAGLTVAMAAVLAGRPALQVLRDAVHRSTDGRAPVGLPLVLAVVWTLTLVGGSVRLLTLIGPLVRDCAQATWLLGTPVDRRALLAPATAGLLAGCAALGSGAGLVVAVLLAGPAALWWTVIATGTFAGLAAGAAALAVQGTARARGLRRVGDGALLAGFLVLTTGGWRAQAQPGQPLLTAGPVGIAWPTLLVVGVLAGAAMLAVPARLARLRRTDLLAGAGLALGLRTSVLALDGSFVVETLRLRSLLRRGTVPAAPLRGRGLLAVVHADARRVLRQRRPVLLVLGATPVLWAVDTLYGPAVVAAAGAGLAWAGAAAAASGLRSISRSSALAQAFPWHDLTLRAVHLVLPATAATLVSLAGAALTGRPGWWVPVLVLVALTGVLRTAPGRQPASFDLLVASPMGAVPVGAVAALLTGPDAVLLASLPLLLGAGPLPCLLLPLVLGVVALLLQGRGPG